MVDVKPLNGIVYNQEKVNMKDVIAPPYDVILDDYRDELYARSPFNVVKLILNKAQDRYCEAAKEFLKWQEEEVLIQRKKPFILYVVQKYTTENGRKIERKGFIAQNKLEPFETKKVLPHEFTMAGPKQDRLELTKACKANFSQIFLVYSDPEMQIENAVDLTQKPFIDVTDDNGVQNLAYIIEDEQTLKLIEHVLEDKSVLIADGHHRYETALAYGKINPRAQYVMSYYTNLDDKNLIVFPTHRIITKRIEPFVLLEKIKKYFDVKEFDFTAATKDAVKEKFLAEIEKANAERISMGLYLKNVNKFYLLSLNKDVSGLIDAPEILKKLDLTVLHELIITKELGYTKEEQMAQVGIKYIKQEHEAFDMIDDGSAEASFIMAYPKMSDIRDISAAGYRMPQKSTYFYPKLLSGLVINPLD